MRTQIYESSLIVPPEKEKKKQASSISKAALSGTLS